MDKTCKPFINLLFAIVILMSMGIVGVSAQDDAACNAPPLLDALGAAVEALQAGDGVDDALIELREALGTYQAVCNGLRWEGTSSTVVGPVEFPTGIYRGVLNSDNAYSSVNLTTVSGDCDFNSLNKSDNQGVFDMEDCTAVIDVTATGDGSWSLLFELIAER